MHWLWVYIVWMVYALLVMGILEAAADRTQNMRGAGTALITGAILGAVLTLVILWFGPVDPFATY